MNTKLADPDFEPTDEELRELSRAAFADAEARHEAALAKFHDEIAEARRVNRERLRRSSP